MKLYLIILSSGLFSFPALATQLIVWNVGQGSWASVVADTACQHFDLGGEQAPVEAALKYCENKVNEAYFSHWDSDHINFAPKAAKQIKNLCIKAPPGGTTTTRKKALFEKISKCQSPANPEIREISVNDRFKRRKKTKSSNGSSRIFTWQDKVIFPGDSTAKEEKIWAERLPFPQKIQLLLLGHHGSHTSTSIQLLKKLTHLRLAIASARWQRYHHPHPEVIALLKQRHIPLLKTEDWEIFTLIFN